MKDQPLGVVLQAQVEPAAFVGAAFVVAGAGKADVVRRVIEGVVAPDVLPA